IPAAEAAAGQDGLAHLFVLPPQSTLTIHVGKRKIKLRPEELQKVTGERGTTRRVNFHAVNFLQPAHQR
ncbi:hypothetical protein, partial [Klebsiella pneumoniae]|uniref:hypothetical protein n=1 Tax=Klebsiella pneumoniae TaxID=573 RepID=UPI0013D3F1DD